MGIGTDLTRHGRASTSTNRENLRKNSGVARPLRFLCVHEEGRGVSLSIVIDEALVSLALGCSHPFTDFLGKSFWLLDLRQFG